MKNPICIFSFLILRQKYELPGNTNYCRTGPGMKDEFVWR